MEDDFTISALFPVARIARPSLVFRKTTRNAITAATAISATRISALPFNGVSARTHPSSWKIPCCPVHIDQGRTSHHCNVNGIQSCIYNNSPASRLSRQLRLQDPVTNPDPDSGKHCRYNGQKGCPLTATAAPTAAPKSKAAVSGKVADIQHGIT